ncbi:MAG: hypothetical protein R3A12_00715 [Ignavibacteria bacterium]
MAKIIKKAVKPVNDSKKDILIDELIEALDKLGYSVRIEKEYSKRVLSFKRSKIISSQ